MAAAKVPTRVIVNGNKGRYRYAFDVTQVLRELPPAVLDAVFRAVDKGWHSRHVLGNITTDLTVTARKVGPPIAPLQHTRWDPNENTYVLLDEPEHWGVRKTTFDAWVCANRPAFLVDRVISNPTGYLLSSSDDLADALSLAVHPEHGWGVTGARSQNHHDIVVEGLRLLGWMLGHERTLKSFQQPKAQYGTAEQHLIGDLTMGWQRGLLYLQAGFGFGEAAAREKTDPVSEENLEFLAALGGARDARYLVA